MNKQRRNKLDEAVKILQNTVEILQKIKEQEDMTRENMPENLETSEMYEHSENCSDTIEDAITDIEGAIESILEIT